MIGTIISKLPRQSSARLRHEMLIVVACIAKLGFPQISFAQSDTVDAEARDGRVLENITVTGSRLIRRDLDAVSPIVTIAGEEFQNSPSLTVEAVLNEFPQLKAANTSQVGIGGGSGVLTADLRGLGPSRTLVLVNGRRFIPGNDEGHVDLSTVPSALIRSVDIVSGGASAVYGSDAIAGAINFTLVDDFEGLQLEYSYGQSSRNDGESYAVDLTFGRNAPNGRGNIVLNVNYSDQDTINSQDRGPTSQVLFEGADGLIPGGSTSIPGSLLSLSLPVIRSLQGVDFVLPDGTIVVDQPCGAVTGIQFDEEARPQPFCLFEDSFDFTFGNVIKRPLERWQVSSLANYELSDQLQAFSEVFVVNNRNGFTWAPYAGNLETQGAGRNTLLVPDFAQNPIVPEPVRSLFLNNPTIFDPNGDGTAEIIAANRRFTELGLRREDFERQSIGITGGLKGNFDFDGESLWFWDSYYTFQRARTDQDLSGYVSNLRLALALDAVVNPETGEAECRNQLLGCRPANVFGVGSLSPEDAQFLAPPSGDTVIIERNMAGGSISGEMFNLPAGKVAVAAGVGWREENFEFRPSAGAAAGEFGGNPTPPNSGKYDVIEGFLETRIPLFSEIPFVRLLDLEGAISVADYSTVGGTEAWRLGFQWHLNESLQLRGARSDAIRAPNLNELFLTSSFVGGQGAIDPCRADQNPSDAVKQICVATGVPADVIDDFEQTAIGFSTRGGGNINLNEESSETWTAGVIISPLAIPNLNIAIDYYDITVDDAISSILPDQILSSCNATLDPLSQPCQAINRIPTTGQLDFIDSSFTNIAQLSTKGLDVQADYLFELPSVLAIIGDSASLIMQVTASTVFESKVTPAPGQDTVDCAGIFGGSCSGGRGVNLTPDLKARLALNYIAGPLSLGLTGRYIASFDPNPRINTVIEKVPSKTYLDLQATYIATESVEIYGGVQNLTDNLPGSFGVNHFGEFGTDTATFDTIGAYPYAGIRVSFQ